MFKERDQLLGTWIKIITFDSVFILILFMSRLSKSSKRETYVRDFHEHTVYNSKKLETGRISNNREKAKQIMVNP